MAGDQDRSDDELGRTATAPGSDPGAAGEAPPLSGELGRYRLQRELGRGGMGVVHAAFDPDLERKVALKVLVTTDVGEARQRLLREARAMARVTHPNVVTVHEVGSTGGRDYIAMELIDGGTLEDWLAEPRSEREIVHAFIAAGRGLAAAHAAGLVHRDFKPRNVLRHKDGRIVVTDFGLVVGIDASPVDAFNTTLRLRSAPATAETTPSSLSGLTATGSVLGTPAYMAPEQWTGGAVGPRADQFAFCVALWESLTKERPYTGKTLDELKEQVCTGQRVDDGKLPRRLRKILARGLDPDPAKRWPSMDALLAAITRSERRPGVAIAIGGAAVAVGAVAFFAFGRSHAGPTCPAPALDPHVVWPAHEADVLRGKHQDLAAAAIDRDMNAWQQAYARACKTPAGTREPELACLDGVLGRLDVVKQALLAANADDHTEVANWLIDPAVCETPRPPRLANNHSNELRTTLVTILRRKNAKAEMKDPEIDQMIGAANADPCASAYAHTYAVDVRSSAGSARELDEAERAAQRCGDDRVIADVAVTAAFLAVGLVSPDARAKLKRAETLVERVAQPDLDAALEMLRAWVAFESDHLDEAISHYESALKLYAKRDHVRSSLSSRLQMIRFYRIRGTPADLAAIPATLDEVRKKAIEKLGEKDGLVRTIDYERALWMWNSGDVEGADALREKLVKPTPADKPRTVRGRVVDEHGAPVAGADVMMGTIQGDSLHAAIPGDDVRSTRSAADGRFEIRDVESDRSLAIAQLGDRRSAPHKLGDDITLALAPTSRISGKVDLHGQPYPAVTVAVIDKTTAMPNNYAVSAPVRPDGSFTLAGVPRGKVHLRTAREGVLGASVSSIDLDIDKPVMEGVALEVRSSARTLRVLVRSVYNVALPNSQVFVIPGKQASTSARDIMSKVQNSQSKIAAPIQAEQASPSVHAKSKPGDLYALISEIPEGEVSACAVALPERLDDPELTKDLQKPENMEKLKVACVPVAPTDDVVVIEVQPWPRFD